jgi:hypothetical protein
MPSVLHRLPSLEQQLRRRAGGCPQFHMAATYHGAAGDWWPGPCGRPAEVTSSWLWDQNSERLIMCLLKITNISVTNNNNCLAIFSSTTAKLCRHHDRLILHLPLTMVTVHLHVLAVLHIYRLFWAVQTNALSWAILQEFYWAELLRCSYANVRVLISLWNKQWRSL